MPPNDKQPQIMSAVTSGNLSKVRDMIEAETCEKKRRVLVNASRRWTECDYRASGFVKEHEWHDLTPIAKAAEIGQ